MRTDENISRYVKRLFLCLLLMSIVLSMSVTAVAEELKFQALLDRNIIYLGQSAQLSLQFEGSTDVPAPALPDMEGFQTRYSGPSTRMSIVNGRMTSSITHIYRLVPVKTGKYTIGPFSIAYNGNQYRSNEIVIEVLDSGSKRQDPEGTQSIPGVSLKDRVFVEMEIDKNRLYINEIANLHIKLFVSSISIRDVQYPQYSHEGFSVDDFEKPREYQVNREGVIYSVLDFQTEIFATQAGTRNLGPAVIRANLLTKTRSRRPHSLFDDSLFNDFFGGYETTPIELKSDVLTIDAHELPVKNMPENFKGAIGNFQLDVSISTDEVKAGDPVTLQMTVTGTGNFDAVHSPDLQNIDGFKLYDPQVKLEPNRKVFEQVIIPTNDNIQKIPDILFSYFDTDIGQYRTIVKGNIPLRVTRVEKEEITILDPAGTIGRPLKKEVLGRDIIYIKESPGKIRTRGAYLYNNPVFIALQAAALVLFVIAAVLYKKRERLSSDPRYARRLAAPRKAGKGIKKAEEYVRKNMPLDFYDAVFRTLRDYLGDRFHLPSGGITAEALDAVLDGKEIEKDYLMKLKKIFNECDMARYAPSGIDENKMNITLNEMKEVIDYFEKHKD